MSFEILLRLNGVAVPVTVDEDAFVAIAEAVTSRMSVPISGAVSPYMTIRETAEYLRCSRQRVDDLLSQRRLTRMKEGARTLVLRDEIEEYLHREGRRL